MDAEDALSLAPHLSGRLSTPVLKHGEITAER